GTYFRKVLSEDCGRAATVGTMYDSDVVGGKLDAGIVSADLRIVPLRDLAEENVGEHFGRKTQRLIQRRQVVSNDDRAQDSRNVENLARRGLQILILHRRIGSAEVNRLLPELLDAATRSDRLVVDLHARVELAVLTQPFLIKRVREGGAGALQTHRAAAATVRTTAGITGKRNDEGQQGAEPGKQLKTS